MGGASLFGGFFHAAAGASTLLLASSIAEALKAAAAEERFGRAALRAHGQEQVACDREAAAAATLAGGQSQATVYELITHCLLTRRIRELAAQRSERGIDAIGRER